MKYDLKCLICGKDFSCTHKEQKYCSFSCYNVSRKGKAPIKGTTREIECPQCKKIFKQKTVKSKFCSRECQATWNNNEMQRGQGYTRKVNCEICGKAFLRKYIAQTCCSQECSRKMRLKIDKRSSLKDDQYKERARKNGFIYIKKFINENNKISRVLECMICGEKVIKDRVRFTCPYCNSSKGERMLKAYCDKNNLEYIYQYTADCKYKSKLRFDFAIKNKGKIIAMVEYQGGQHYEPVDWFGGQENFAKQQARDKVKKDYYTAKNIKLIEIPYWIDDIEIFMDKELDSLDSPIQLKINNL